MFLFTNKKVIGVWTFEVRINKWIEKSEGIHKTLQWKYHFTSDWYHFYLLFICIDFTAKYKINETISLDKNLHIQIMGKSA